MKTGELSQRCKSLPEVSEWFFRLAAGNLNRVFFVAFGEGFLARVVFQSGPAARLFSKEKVFCGGFLFFSLRGGSVASGEGFFCHTGQGFSPTGKSLFLSEQKK